MIVCLSRSNCISTHDLTRRSTGYCNILRNFIPFQLTTSRGGRQELITKGPEPDNISTHDLTRRSTVLFLFLSAKMGYFNSRPHEEVDKICSPVWIVLIHFNSRPHEEVDFLSLSVLYRANIFQLTTSRGGRQISEMYNPLPVAISTHDLTRRSTANSSDLITNILFQLTTSRGGRPHVITSL